MYWFEVLIWDHNLTIQCQITKHKQELTEKGIIKITSQIFMDMSLQII